MSKIPGAQAKCIWYHPKSHATTCIIQAGLAEGNRILLMFCKGLMSRGRKLLKHMTCKY